MSSRVDFRALCAELLSALENEGYAHWTVIPDEDELCLRARAALAQPEPEGPTDEELWDLYQGLGRDFSPSEFARAVLACWGHPTLQPIPVSERLPEAGDCDAEGRCWWAANDGIYHHWRKLDLEKALNSPWRPTHWLPAHALPLPQEPEQ